MITANGMHPHQLSNYMQANTAGQEIHYPLRLNKVWNLKNLSIHELQPMKRIVFTVGFQFKKSL
ncbi:MAG: hypothetical protein M3P08_17620 [Thermoproteota archaeon]|nr:hypothetical protein [Thermoproteota archaeon]